MKNYEQKYKEALEVAKRKLCFDKAGMVDSFTPNDIYEIFPELKESDDERIREALITAVSGTFKGKTLWHTDVTREEALVWLKKQGEQKQEEQPRYNIGDVICDKSCTTLNKKAQPNMEIVDIKNGMYICDKGSFPVSQQDEYELVSRKIDTKLNDDSVSNELRAASVKHAEKELKNHTFPNNEEFELVYTFEEGAKWNAEQKPTWSEEDKKIIDRIESEFLALHRGDYKDIDFNDVSSLTVLNWVRKIKSLRFQNTWKPSDKQIKALENFTRSVGESGYISPYDDNTKLLYSLLEDLKKLK